MIREYRRKNYRGYRSPKRGIGDTDSGSYQREIICYLQEKPPKSGVFSGSSLH